jgi:hypothetical protein
VVFTTITLTTLTQLGTTTAAAKYGMNPIEPVADRGSKKLRSSAVTASPQRIRASVIIADEAVGALLYMANVQSAASAAMHVT